jgi:hypothetical protein
MHTHIRAMWTPPHTDRPTLFSVSLGATTAPPNRAGNEGSSARISLTCVHARCEFMCVCVAVCICLGAVWTRIAACVCVAACVFVAACVSCVHAHDKIFNHEYIFLHTSRIYSCTLDT